MLKLTERWKRKKKVTKSYNFISNEMRCNATVAQKSHTCKLKMLLQTKTFTCKLKMLLQIKNRTCKLKIVHAN